MNQKLIAIIVAVLVVASAGTALYFATGGNGGGNNGSGATVTDCEGREVAIPDNLDNGIVTIGWNVLKVLSFFDAHTKVNCVDYMETINLGTLQPHYYCYDMANMGVHTDSTMGGFTEADAEKIVNSNPSLVIMTSSVYEGYQTVSDNLAKGCTLVVIDLSAMSNNFWEEKDGNLVVESKIQESLHILGDVLKENSRDEQIINTLNNTLADIISNRISGASPKVNLSGSQMAMGSGDLNLVFPMFNVLNLAGADNAAKNYPVPPWFATLTPEEFTTGYDYDVILYDPSAPQALSNPDDQAILEWLYNHQGAPGEKEIYVILTTALCGYDMMNVIADAYFVEAKIGGTITMEQMKSKMTALYKDLFGETVGSTLWDNLCDTMEARGAANGVYTGLWEQVKVGQVGGTYTFVHA